jgi:hypothetical protein
MKLHGNDKTPTEFKLKTKSTPEGNEIHITT